MTTNRNPEPGSGLYLISAYPQGTAEWRADRAGKATGSKANCITAEGRTKGAEAVTRRDYRFQLVAERMSGSSMEESFVSKEMAWGTEQEPFARMAFEALTGEIVEEAGFLYRPDMPIGCSLDGFTGNRRGIFEAKCPKMATHIEYLLANRIPPAYVDQLSHNLWVTGCEYVDFCSFDPRWPEALQLFHVRAMRNEFDLKGYEAKLLQFVGEVDALEMQLLARAMKLKVAA